MQPKVLSTSLLLIVSFAGIIFYSVLIFFPEFNPANQNFYINAASLNNQDAGQNLINGKPAESGQGIVFIEPAHLPVNKDIGQNVTEPANLGLPIRLKIPKIKVNAMIEHVNLAPDGSMSTPKDPFNVAWYKTGPRPGDNGSAVIAGHYGYWENGTPTVFNNLNKLSPGDKLYIENNDGSTAIFVVRENLKYESKADASNVFASNDQGAHLNLITCDGIWDKISQSYPKRLVIFADKE